MRSRPIPFRRDQRGLSLLEVAVVLVLVAALLIPLAGAVASIINEADRVYDRTNLAIIAKSQLEDALSRPYAPSTSASYPLLSNLPSGYTVAIAVTKPIAYIYAAPSGQEAPEVLQRIQVTVTGRYGSFTLQGFKVGA